MQEALYYELMHDDALVALIGERLYPAPAPETAVMPFMTYQRTDKSRERHQGGSSGMARPIYQFDIWAASELAAHNVMEAFEAVIENFRGELGEAGDAVTVPRALIESDRDEFVPPSDASQRGAHRITAEVSIWQRT